MSFIRLSSLALGGTLALAPILVQASESDTQKDRAAQTHAHEEKHKEQHAEQDHSSHKSELKGMQALHAWARAAHKGEDALVFVELKNRSANTILFQGGKSKYAQSVELVGFQLKDGTATYSPIKHVPIKQGRELHLEPKALALRLNDLTQDLHQGESFKMGLNFDIGHMHVFVEVGKPNATQHSHAGHNHD